MNKLYLFLAVSVWMSAELSAQISTNQTNSVVRFRITAGNTLLGDMDVELFDSEKPVTVRNFLRYVQTGGYQNVFLHRCLPRFVLQGGGFRTANPLSGSLFDNAFYVANFGNITNEFGTGPLRSNSFGTLAMAKTPGEPNSASSQWFFNLANNSAELDNQNGGFTVFGRVISGTNVLHYFNGLSKGGGLVDMRLFYADAIWELFRDLPVNYFGLVAPRYFDLFHVQITALIAPDVVPPTVSITSPAAKARLTNAMVRATGTAGDNISLLGVSYRLNTNATTFATGTTNWAADLVLQPGTNTLVVESIDQAGNRSTALSRVFSYIITSPLTLQIVGSGSVSGATDGQILEIGKSYKLTATPGAGQLFAGWSGGITASAPALTFVMQSNLTLIATFYPNPFAPVKGSYNGLFYETNAVRHPSSGYVTAAVTGNGTYSGSLSLTGSRFSLTGQFNSQGGATNTLTRAGLSSLTINLQLDLTNGSGQITGRVTDGNWAAELLANRSAFNVATNPCPFVGKYTWINPGGTNGATSPDGEGFASVTVDGAGLLSLKGVLADGTKIAQKKVALSRNGEWPFYGSLHNGKGSILGWVAFTNRATDSLNGEGTWIKTGQALTPLYLGGFTNHPMMHGSTYNLPLGGKVLNFTDGVVVLRGGNLTQNWTNTVTLGADNKVANTSSNTVNLTIVLKTGLFKGSFVEPGTGRKVSFAGALQQKQNAGYGYFLGGSQSGEVLFEAAP